MGAISDFYDDLVSRLQAAQAVGKDLEGLKSIQVAPEARQSGRRSYPHIMIGTPTYAEAEQEGSRSTARGMINIPLELSIKNDQSADNSISNLFDWVEKTLDALETPSATQDRRDNAIGGVPMRMIQKSVDDVDTNVSFIKARILVTAPILKIQRGNRN
tara:strand:- start:180 stop:656 length:477 start_codon:yes stop_codon:yes gene_type:complete